MDKIVKFTLKIELVFANNSFAAKRIFCDITRHATVITNPAVSDIFVKRLIPELEKIYYS